MDSKQISKYFKRSLGRFGLSFSLLIMRYLPERAVYGFANFVGNLGYVLAAKKRQNALESLDIAFGKEKDAKEMRRIAKASFVYMARGVLELLHVVFHPNKIRQKVTIEGKDNLDRALSEGKGAVCVTAHFGNFPLMLVKFADEGYKTNSVMRNMRDPQIEVIFQEKRTQLGIRTIHSQPRQQCVSDCIKSLRDNELLFIQLDQNFGTGGVFVDFFGTQAATATGPVVFAMRTGSPLLPVFIVRNQDNTHRIIIEPPLHIEEKATSDETILVNVARITKIIESYIRKFPEEWGWIHRRWKSRPVSN